MKRKLLILVFTILNFKLYGNDTASFKIKLESNVQYFPIPKLKKGILDQRNQVNFGTGISGSFHMNKKTYFQLGYNSLNSNSKRIINNQNQGSDTLGSQFKMKYNSYSITLGYTHKFSRCFYVSIYNQLDYISIRDAREVFYAKYKEFKFDNQTKLIDYVDNKVIKRNNFGIGLGFELIYELTDKCGLFLNEKCTMYSKSNEKYYFYDPFLIYGNISLQTSIGLCYKLKMKSVTNQ